MTLRQLRYFIAAAQYLNFSRAAEALYVSQHALSHQITELERELKVALFNRTRRNITLTAEGQKFLDSSYRVIQLVDDMERFGSTGPDVPKQLRIGFDASELPTGWLEESRVISSFIARFPEIQLHTFHLPQQECQRRVMSYDLDLALILLRHGETPDANLSSRTFFTDSIALLVSMDLGITSLEDAIAQLPLTIIENYPLVQNRVLKSLTELGLEPNILYQDSLLSCLIQTQAGRGAMLMPIRNFLALPSNNLRMIPIPGDPVSLRRATIWSKNNPNEALETFLKHTKGML